MTMPAAGLRKDVENRSWPCPANMIGHRFAIHAAKTWDPEGARRIHDAGLRFPNENTITRGAFVALATIDRCVTSADELPLAQRRWFFGPYGFVFRDLAVLPKAIPCRGMQGFWRVPDAHLGEMIGQLVAQARDYVAEHYASLTETHAAALISAVRRTGRSVTDLDVEAAIATNTTPVAWLEALS